MVNRTFTFPAYKFIGFEDFLNETFNPSNDPSTFPRYNLVKTGDSNYRLEFALAGYTQNDVDITLHEGLLTVSSNGQQNEDKVEYIHRGVSAKRFKREFKLAEFVEVTNATFIDGMLIIQLQKNVPEEKMPRKIEIKTKQLLLEGDNVL